MRDFIHWFWTHPTEAATVVPGSPGETNPNIVMATSIHQDNKSSLGTVLHDYWATQTPWERYQWAGIAALSAVVLGCWVHHIVLTVAITLTLGYLFTYCLTHFTGNTFTRLGEVQEAASEALSVANANLAQVEAMITDYQAREQACLVDVEQTVVERDKARADLLKCQKATVANSQNNCRRIDRLEEQCRERQKLFKGYSSNRASARKQAQLAVCLGPC